MTPAHQYARRFHTTHNELRASIERVPGHYAGSLTDDALASAIASLIEMRPDIIARAQKYAALRARVQIAGNEVRNTREPDGGLTSGSRGPIHEIGAGGLPTPRTEAGTSHPRPSHWCPPHLPVGDIR